MENDYHPGALTSREDKQERPLLRMQRPHLDPSDEGGLDVGQVLAALRRRAMIILGITTVVTGLALLKGLSSEASYEAGFEILTKPISVESQVAASITQSLNSQESALAPLDNTTLAVLQSPKLFLPIVEQLRMSDPDVTYDSLLASLTIGKRQDSNILQVTYKDSNPVKVKQVVDLLSQAYIAYSLEERQADVRKGLNFVESQLPQLKQQVNSLQEQLQRFRQQYNLADPESQAQQLSTRISALQQERQQTQIALDEAQVLYRTLQQQVTATPTESRVSSALSSSSNYQTLINQLRTVDTLITQKSTIFVDQSPEMERLREQRRNVLALLNQEAKRVRDEIKSRINEIKARQQSLNSAERKLAQQMKQWPLISRQHTDIQRQLQIATTNLSQFLAKREALQIDAAQQDAPWQILTPPTTLRLSTVSLKQSGLLGASLGLLLGIGVALLVDKFKNVLHTSDDAKEEVGLPLLGVIPYHPKREALKMPPAQIPLASLLPQVRSRVGLAPLQSQLQSYCISPFQEAFNSLYTNIRLLSTDKSIRSIVISSACVEDGKSTVSVHLAQAAAALGHQVLLVDVDLRRPRLHERLKLTNDVGVSDLITSNLELNEVIQRSPLDHNLSVLTSGKIPPDPVRLLSSHKMQDLMQQLEAKFDLVIYDTPPILDLSDVHLIAPRTDGLVLVVGLGRTNRLSLQRSLEALRMAPTILLGIVANSSQHSPANFYSNYMHVSEPDLQEAT
ncbi:MAG: polysaccharide biosynthesis tyrosine autokinase [Leptolyngbyaceae bacterium]|nr:polysaccharide biosynthesis tyrosine autokinase [Leptolyngbyaceae bacterium]